MTNDIVIAIENLKNYIKLKEPSIKFNKIWIDCYQSYKATKVKSSLVDEQLEKCRKAYLDKLSTELISAFGLDKNKGNDLVTESLKVLYQTLIDFYQSLRSVKLSQQSNHSNNYSNNYSNRNKLQKKRLENEWILIEN